MENEHHPIALWREDDRPREKFMHKGRNALSDAELLAIILGSGSSRESAVELSKRILKDFSSLRDLGTADLSSLTNYRGIGEAKAISLMACMEVARRSRNQNKSEKSPIQSSQQAFHVLYPKLADLQHEEFWILLLNRANYLIRPLHISTGGMSGTVADAKLIFRHAIEQCASALILAHNHPSGNRNPSEADKKLTRQLKKAAELLDIAVLDHLILADDTYFSFADEGLMTG